jgi:hypothetical protein
VLPRLEMVLRLVDRQPLLRTTTFSVACRRWTNFVCSSGGVLPTLVDFELCGITIHVWETSTMAQLLSLFTPSGRVTLLPFQCSTWTLDPASIPTCKELWIVEPPSVADDASLPLGKRTLVYPVDILYSVSFFFANYIQFQFTVLSHLLLIPTHRMGWTLEKAPAGPLWVSPSLPFSIKRG